jgi:hypothetical protein
MPRRVTSRFSTIRRDIGESAAGFPAREWVSPQQGLPNLALLY